MTTVSALALLCRYSPVHLELLMTISSPLSGTYSKKELDLSVKSNFKTAQIEQTFATILA